MLRLGPIDLTDRRNKAVILLAVLALWLIFFPIEVPPFSIAIKSVSRDELLDWMLRHQAAAFAVLGILVSGITGLVVLLWLFRRATVSSWRVADRIRQFLRFSWRRLTWRVITIWGGAILGITLIGMARPVNPMSWLKLPEPSCRDGAPQLILFVHGWLGDREETWKQFPRLVCSDPNFADTEVIVVHYPTAIDRRNPRLSELSDWIGKILKRDGARKRNVVILAHSMGGLLARDMLLRRTFDADRTRILVEFATPHSGPTIYAQFLSILGLPGGDIVKEMASGSTTLDRIKDEWNGWNAHPATQCYWGSDDSVVSRDSATFQCDHYSVVPAVGHRDLVKPLTLDDRRYADPMNDVKEALLRRR
jgi:hypothetical protein